MTPGKTTILYVIENESFGGGERAFAQLINGLDRRRYEVCAACLVGPRGSGSAVFTGAIEGAARILDLDLRGRASLSAYFRLKKFILENGVRIAHSQGARADFYARTAARAAGAAVVSTVASPVEEYDVPLFRRAVYTALDRATGLLVDRFVAVADHIEKKLVSGRGVPARKVVRIYNGVEAFREAGHSSAIRAALGIPEGAFLAGAVSRLSREKGLSYFIEAAGIIAGSGAAPGMKYLIAGEGPLERELKAMVSARGLEKDFIFAGFVKDVSPLLEALDVLVLPSLREGFPMAVLEAMSAGKPVIASDIDGVKESVSGGESGLLVPPGDARALAGAMLSLFRDRAAAAAMGRRGGELAAARFGLDRTIKAHEALYEELAGSGGSTV